MLTATLLPSLFANAQAMHPRSASAPCGFRKDGTGTPKPLFTLNLGNLIPESVVTGP